ncbi:hypothetical protein vseg_012930 [Gypsophila vaccaria]
MRLVSLFIIVVATIGGLCQAATSEDDIKKYLDVHNVARSKVGVPPLVWNQTLAVYAEEVANTRKSSCAPRNSGGPYGENTLVSYVFKADQAVGMWVNESRYYDPKSNTCTDGSDDCRHYTQVVWSRSVGLGCATTLCAPSWPFSFYVCEYYPPGNIQGQKPY